MYFDSIVSSGDKRQAVLYVSLCNEYSIMSLVAPSHTNNTPLYMGSPLFTQTTDAATPRSSREMYNMPQIIGGNIATPRQTSTVINS